MCIFSTNHTTLTLTIGSGSTLITDRMGLENAVGNGLFAILNSHSTDSKKRVVDSSADQVS
jgi:hypothetical protein